MKRKTKDALLQGVTVLSSLLSVAVLVSLFWFMIQKGASSLSIDLLKNDYWSKNYLVSVCDNQSGNFTLPDAEEGVSYSLKWGIGLKDEISASKEKRVEIVYLDENSPFQKVISETAGEGYHELVEMNIGNAIEKIDGIDEDGNIIMAGKILNQDAAKTIESLDQMTSITSIYMKTQGGGIRSSVVTTLYLIVISILIALPIGISAAIYLNEIAKKNRLNHWIRTGIELLTGVPSIVYGLMGVSVLFPVTQLFGATTTSILLGALTMAVILLPTIIRSTEEALRVVPQSLRDGSSSLGATKTQTIFKIVLPCCMNGILTGVLLGIGRVIGESAALIYTMGTFINDTPSLLSQGTSLSVMIWTITSSEQPNYELACAISLLILALVFVLNLSVKFIGKKLSRTWN